MLKLIQFLMIFSFIPNSSNIQEPLQFVLNLENLEEVIKEKSVNGTCFPMVLVTNGVIPLDMELTMFNQKVELVENKEDSDLINQGHSFISIVKSRVKSKIGKAEFDMIFNDNTLINVQLKKEDIWVFKSLFSRSKKSGYKNFSYDRDF